MHKPHTWNGLALGIFFFFLLFPPSYLTLERGVGGKGAIVFICFLSLFPCTSCLHAIALFVVNSILLYSYYPTPWGVSSPLLPVLIYLLFYFLLRLNNSLGFLHYSSSSSRTAFLELRIIICFSLLFARGARQGSSKKRGPVGFHTVRENIG